MSQPSSEARARIRVLDTHLANQIAAGEVVERPASVLKELLENALDAGATRIQVQIERGGMGTIHVRDDGVGIHVDDLALALERHATSKVRTLRDLETVRTLGFRGEALPSIASVSRMKLVSRQRGAVDAWSVEVDGDADIAAPRPAAHSHGTSVEVRDLFFNTPARRRFLRSERTEFRHLEHVFRRLALSRMDVAMSLSHNQREVLRVAAAEGTEARRRRAARILRGGFMDRVHDISLTREELSVHGWVQDAADAGARADQQYLFVNGRAVVDTTVRHAVRLAYGDALERGQHPGWVLFLSAPEREVDVNVHPTKQEVRFHQARRVHDFIRFAAARGLDALAPRGVGVAHDASAKVPAPSPRPRTSNDAPTQIDGSLRQLHPLALIEQRVLLLRDGDRILVATIPRLAEFVARRRLDAARGGERAVSRPLLLPERFEWRHGEEAFERMAEALLPLGIVVRQLTHGTGVLQALPRCLETVPASRLAQCLGCVSAADPRAFEQVLAALGDARARDVEQALGLLNEARTLRAADEPAPWRVLDADALARVSELG